jgi:hypothetical protein
LPDGGQKVGKLCARTALAASATRRQRSSSRSSIRRTSHALRLALRVVGRGCRTVLFCIFCCLHRRGEGGRTDTRYEETSSCTAAPGTEYHLRMRARRYAIRCEWWAEMLSWNNGLPTPPLCTVIVEYLREGMRVDVRLCVVCCRRESTLHAMGYVLHKAGFAEKVDSITTTGYRILEPGV